MEVDFFNVIRMWTSDKDPDTSVHNKFHVYADVGEFFLNTSKQEIFICTIGGKNQSWKRILTLPEN